MHSPEGSGPVLIVDRPGWVDANVDSLESMLEPVIKALLAKRKTPATASPLILGVGGKVTGAEVGALTAFLASRILGQYDLAPDGPTGCNSRPCRGCVTTSSTQLASSPSAWRRTPSSSAR